MGDMMKKRPVSLQVRPASGFTAGNSVVDLGITFSSGPPELTIVDAVTKGSWADNVGIHSGDVVTQVGTTLARDLVCEEFDEAFAKRPIHLHVIPAAAFKKHSLAKLRPQEEVGRLLARVK